MLGKQWIWGSFLILVQIQNALSDTTPQPATETTKNLNAAVLKSFPFEDTSDFADAQRGFIAKPDTLTIKNDKDRVVWDLESFKKYIQPNQPAPDTVNPSLWRNAQLNMNYGLFKVTDNIYQVRGYDIANMTLIAGKTGWILLDVLLSAETAKAALDYANQQLGKRPIVAVIYSHSHADHYGGIKGVIGEEDEGQQVRIIAPQGFTEAVMNENLIAGNAMRRRSIYMYGPLLPRNPQGSVGIGLGQGISSGTITFIEPTDLITETGQKLTIDGVPMEFQLTPGTEAPAEMNTYFPDSKALWLAENATNTMHNILTLRGAQVRDPYKWAMFLNEALTLYGDKATVKFQNHHWPQWGNAKIVDYIKKQRDLYKYINDQSLRLMNAGYIGSEIAEQIQLPPELGQFWPNREYYGTLRHNSRAVYQRYMGWYTGNPSDLNDLPPQPAAEKYIAYMGGEKAVLDKATADFNSGNYRWVATVLRHVVFANPNNLEAKHMLADTYEQLGYQAESGIWRSIYLQGAYELRYNVPDTSNRQTSDIIAALTPEMLFDYLAIHVDGPKTFGKKFVLNVTFTDLNKPYSLVLENGVLNYFPYLAAKADTTVELKKASLSEIQAQGLTIREAVKRGKVKISGNIDALRQFVSWLDKPSCCFNIVTP